MPSNVSPPSSSSPPHLSPQIPLFIRPVSLLYSGTAGLQLSACSLAAIFRGDVTFWNDGLLLADNPSFQLSNATIALRYLSVSGSGDVAG